jgi:dolichol-phosphate mannosyltransferase
MNQTLFVVLPAYNEAACISELCKNIAAALANKAYSYRIVIVDDGSADNTLQIARAIERDLPITVFAHPKNLGLGATIRDCILRSMELASSEDIIISMDADNTHPPGVIPALAAAITAGNDVVIASRFRKGAEVHGVPLLRRLLSDMASLIFRLLLPIPGVRDYTCGFRAYRASAIRKAMDHWQDRLFTEKGFQCMADILLKMRVLGLRFSEIPFTLRYDKKQGVTKMKVLKTIGMTLMLVVKHKMKKWS